MYDEPTWVTQGKLCLFTELDTGRVEAVPYAGEVVSVRGACLGNARKTVSVYGVRYWVCGGGTVRWRSSERTISLPV